jgi:hypothetical protein
MACAYTGHINEYNIMSADDTKGIGVSITHGPNILYIQASVEKGLNGISFRSQGAKNGGADLMLADGLGSLPDCILCR